jgi:Bax protein
MKFLFNILLVVTLASAVNANTFTADFFKIQNSDVRKREFAKRMMPLIKTANEAIVEERAIVDDFFTQFKKVRNLEKMDQDIVEKMRKLAEKYEIKSILSEKTFKTRVLPVPPSLALTQSAIETGWGTSRFFKEANNAFGQWTYSKTNGIVPSQRDDDKSHKIRAFDTVQASVNAYMLNLNRNDAYSGFRDLRVILGNDFNGITATSKMLNYSQRREKYVELLREIMIDNKLLKYDYV